MGIKDKLLKVKEAVTDSIEEFAETSELNAEEYAKYYGGSYTNFLNYIKKQKFNKSAEEYNQGTAQSIDEVEFVINLPIASIKDKEIIFDDQEFGTKEKFNLTILKNLLYKARVSYEISEDLSTMTLTQDRTERLSDRVEKLSEDKDVYVDKAKELVNLGSSAVKAKTKELINNLYDWSNKNL